MKKRLSLFLGILILAVAAIALVIVLFNYRHAERLTEEASSAYTVPTVLDTEEALAEPESLPTEAESEMLPSWEPVLTVELEALSADYPDVIGWIAFENVDLSYPILFSGDNETYLDKAYNGETSRAGSIFLDGESSPDFSDPHTLLYGHNMRDLSMFGRLKAYADLDYLTEHRYFQIFSENRVIRYEIFASGEISDNDEIYYAYGADTDLTALLPRFSSLSVAETDLTIDASDHLLTLSTCTGDDETRRIVTAVRVDERTLP